MEAAAAAEAEVAEPCEAAKLRQSQQQADSNASGSTAAAWQQQEQPAQPQQPLQEQQEQQHCCRREFHALFFGRRDSLRYRQQVEAAADLIADPYRLGECDERRERQERMDKQLRLQLILGGSVLVFFVVTFSVIISLLLSREESHEHLRMEPRNSQGGGFVSFDPANDDDLVAVLGRIGGELAEYEVRRWHPRLVRAGRRPKDCEAAGAYPTPGREVCVPRLAATLGACNVYGAFGYLMGDPCIVVKPGPALAGNYTEDLLVRCQATLDGDGAALELRYHPRVTYLSRVYAYFPRYFFPHPGLEDSFYLPPLVMVQVLRPPRGRSFHLNCSLANPGFANVSTQASLGFLFE